MVSHLMCQTFPLLLFLSLTLPLRLLPSGLRVLHGPSRRGGLWTHSSAFFLVSIPILFLSILALSEKETFPERKYGFSSEVEELRLKMAELESILQDSSNILSSKINQLEENDRIIEAMNLKIQLLRDSMDDAKKQVEYSSYSSYSEDKINTMEEELRLLWAESRKNNFDIHKLESKAHDGQKKLEVLRSEVHKMEDIVAEQWIQIQQIEQALQLTKMRTCKASKKKGPTRCMLLKFFEELHKHHVPKVLDLLGSYFSEDTRSILRHYISKASHHLKKTMLLIQGYHHELQYSVKEVLESNESTANLTNKEFIFFLASAIIVFPILITIRLVTG